MHHFRENASLLTILLLMGLSPCLARPSTFLPENVNWENVPYSTKRYFLPRQVDYFSSFQKRNLLTNDEAFLPVDYDQEGFFPGEIYSSRYPTFQKKSLLSYSRSKDTPFLPEQNDNRYPNYQKRTYLPSESESEFEKKDFLFLPQQVESQSEKFNKRTALPKELGTGFAKRDFLFLPQQYRDRTLFLPQEDINLQKKDLLFLPQQMDYFYQKQKKRENGLSTDDILKSYPKKDLLFLPQQLDYYRNVNKRDFLPSESTYGNGNILPKILNRLQNHQKRAYLAESGSDPTLPLPGQFLPGPASSNKDQQKRSYLPIYYRPNNLENWLSQDLIHRRQFLPEPNGYLGSYVKRGYGVMDGGIDGEDAGRLCRRRVDVTGQICCVPSEHCVCAGHHICY